MILAAYRAARSGRVEAVPPPGSAAETGAAPG